MCCAAGGGIILQLAGCALITNPALGFTVMILGIIWVVCLMSWACYRDNAHKDERNIWLVILMPWLLINPRSSVFMWWGVIGHFWVASRSTGSIKSISGLMLRTRYLKALKQTTIGELDHNIEATQKELEASKKISERLQNHHGEALVNALERSLRDLEATKKAAEERFRQLFEKTNDIKQGFVDLELASQLGKSAVQIQINRAVIRSIQESLNLQVSALNAEQEQALQMTEAEREKALQELNA